MESPLSTANKIRLVELYYENGRSYSEAQRKFSTEENIKRKSDAPAISTISDIIAKFQQDGCVNKKHTHRASNVSSEKREAIDNALDTMRAEGIIPSVRKLSAASGSSVGTVHSHLRHELHLFPYKITLGQHPGKPEATDRECSRDSNNYSPSECCWKRGDTTAQMPAKKRLTL